MKHFSGREFRSLISIISILTLQGYFLAFPHEIDSANLNIVRDTLSSSRISGAARVDGTGTTVGGSELKILGSGTGTTYTTTTNNWMIGDTLKINANNYTITGIASTSATLVTVSPVIQAGDATNATPIYLINKPTHWIQFNTDSALANGFFRVLVPASSTANSNDGTPDINGFDFNGSSATAASITNFNFAHVVATASGAAGCTSPANYHCYEYHYAGSGGAGTGISLFINNLIAPAPADASEAQAETYPIIVRAYDSTASLIDATTARVGLIESVRLTATVDPTISFTIAGLGTTACGIAPSVDTSTTPLSVGFGTMGLNTFKNAAHQLTVSTNGANGYTVTAIENDQMGKDGGTTPFIPDTTCDGGSCTHTTSTNWVTATNNGLGYAIQNVSAATISATYNGYSEFARSFSAKQFPSAAEAETPETIMSSSTVSNAEQANVCYRLSVGATQAAGDYMNQVTYTATAKF